MAQTAQAGRVLNGRYRLEEKLGEGGMGQIWRAEHLILKAPVAVKLVDREAVPDDETLARFIREAQAAAAIRSPHVVQILDYGTDDKLPFMVMELLEGETLAQKLRREKKLSPPETAQVITHIARAVGRAHEEGIVHRDLKPENVFLLKNDDEEVAKVLDFGVAKVESASLGNQGTRTRTGSILGTPYYMSPEQAQGNKTVDFRSDLWAMAVIAFECLTGKRPFYSDGLGDLVLQICIRDIPIPSRVAPVPLGFDGWFKKATQRDPDERHQSARELVETLRDVLGLEPRETWAGPDVLVSSEGSLPPPSHQPSSRSEAITEIASPEQLPEPGVKPVPDAGPAAQSPSAPARESRPASTPAPGRTTPGRTTPARSHHEMAGPASGLAARFSAAAGAASAPRPTQSSDSDRVVAHTIQQFGTTKLSTPPPVRRSSSGLVWGVAGSALVLGVVLGFAYVSRGGSSVLGDQPESALQPPPRVTTPPLEATTSNAPSEEASAAPSTAAPPASSLADEVPLEDEDNLEDDSDPALDAGSLELDAEVQAEDAGDDAWVKPEWARPDDEGDQDSMGAPTNSPKANPY